MKKLLLSIVAALGILTAGAADSPLWMRYSAISPDGSQIAFCYKGDIYKVSSAGGKAVQLTTHPAYDTQPAWSPDGKTIAFSSNRKGSQDVYIMSAEGGEPTRLTTHSGNETVIGFRDSDHILFSANIQPDSKNSQFPSPLFVQVYEVNIKGGRPTRFSEWPMEDMSFDSTGKKILYHDKKGYEDPWRKHHQSSIARDIWMYDAGATNQFRKITTFKGEDRNPIWTADNQSFYYLSERDGTFNVYKQGINSSEPKQLTTFKDHPVRFLTSSKDGLLSFFYNGELYTMREGGQPTKLAIQIIADDIENKYAQLSFRSGASDLALSPNEKEIAYIIRGDVFVSSLEYGTTRRITDTPEQERSVSFSPDGRSLLYAAERDGLWNIYQTSLKNKDDKDFVYSLEFEEEQITHSAIAAFQPLYSPDGKEVAFLEDRTTLQVVNLKNKKVRTVLEGKFNYSYADGDQWFQWSPDSKWLLTKYIGVGGWNNTDIALVSVDSVDSKKKELTNLTQSGYSDSSPKFVLDGKAMLWFSDRAGYRSHGSWGAHFDAYLMFFDAEAYDEFSMSKEELEMWSDQKTREKKRKEEEQAKKEEEKAEKRAEKNEAPKAPKVKDLEFDLDNRDYRTVRVTPNSSSLADAVLSKDGSKLYYLTRFESGYDLWIHDIKERSSRILAKSVGGGSIVTDKAMRYIYMIAGGQLKKIEMGSGRISPISISAEFNYRPESERAYIFNHVWKQVKDKFYVTDLHGVDWDMYKTAYERFLPHINNNTDFAELLSELLGELNASHTGASAAPSGRPTPTAALGIFIDESFDGDGLKVTEVIKNGPLDNSTTKVDVGTVILKIDGKEIVKGEDYYPLLEGKSGKKILLTYKPKKGKEREEWITPISYGLQNALLYRRWVDQRREMVDKLSGGRIGYVHIKGMDSPSFRTVYSELLGRCRGKDAVVVDTRHNGGGWLHDDLVTLLTGKEYQRFEPRGQYIGSDPFNKWLKPSAVLVCEDNYSNAHGFPWLYKELKIGKLIGAPVPGTMTAVWWETQIDPSIVFGIPQVAVKDMRGNYLENQELQPDVEVYNDPASTLEGRDKQLEKAVEVLLQDLK